MKKKTVSEQKSAASSPQDFDKHCLIEENEVIELIDKATEILLSQPMLLELLPPLNICGTLENRIFINYILNLFTIF